MWGYGWSTDWVMALLLVWLGKVAVSQRVVSSVERAANS
jgi:hypothetical protein